MNEVADTDDQETSQLRCNGLLADGLGRDWSLALTYAQELHECFLPWIKGFHQDKLHDPTVFSCLCKIVDGVRERSKRDQESLDELTSYLMELQ